MLSSPHFLYRVEVGEPDPDDASTRRYTSWEMASRLSFFLWNSTPDEALLDAAEAGTLLEDEGLKSEVLRLLDDPQAHTAVRNFFADWLGLYELDELNKDPNIFKHFSVELGPSAREETLLLVEHLVFEKQADIRDLMTTETTFVNRRLASIYNVPAAQDEGFGEISLPADGPRAGFLGQVSFLGLHAHAVSSSPTVRGLFIRERLLCHDMPLPPANLNTSIPEVSDEAKTLKERLMVHMEDPACSGCHELMDPIGFALEHFDGLGRYRVLDNGGEIDAVGNLDSAAFDGARGLAQAVREHPDFVPCFVDNAYAYATGHLPGNGEDEQMAVLRELFATSGYRVKDLFLYIATSPGFRQVGEVE